VHHSTDSEGKDCNSRVQEAGIEGLVHRRIEVAQRSEMSVAILGLRTAAWSSREVVAGCQEDL
jgi:hypothetical protein